MTDTVFRTQQESAKEPQIIGKEQDSQSIVEEQVPYLDYELEHGHPYTVDYFKLGDNWEVFDKELRTIDAYINGKIYEGSLANNVETIQKEIKRMEKMNNLKDEPRTVVKIDTLVSYVKFLMEADNIKHTLHKYGRTN
ncbi:MAG: hypothetical protein A2163_07920 [Actinobacteria bacterium RBG_13_35_12]|nr:MAG: hypothetical protein A2163_07920 [Actinobacteria bacterium RBG_13_35_12]